MLELLATIFGIGFLLFIHECGHFIAARLAGVRVETFSLGFGPRLLGWRRKGTDFRIAAIPIGGYVRMAGEDQTRAPLPDELGAASIGWRFFIFSGGILMNFAFALVAFPILFSAGVPFESPVAGQVQPGGAAWRAGIREGERILSVNGRQLYAYRHFASSVALSGEDETLEIELQGLDGGVRTVALKAEFDPEVGFRRLGINPPIDPSGLVQVIPGTPAAEAGLVDGDRILSLDGTPVVSAAGLRVLIERAGLRRGDLLVEAGRGEEELRLDLPPPVLLPDTPPQVGIRALSNRVHEVQAPLAGIFQPGDILLTAGGQAVLSSADFFGAAFDAGQLPPVLLERGGQPLEIADDDSISPDDLLAGLWIDQHPVDVEQGLRVTVTQGGPAWRAGLRDGDLVIQAGGEPVDSIRQLAGILSAAKSEAVEFLYQPVAGGDPVTAEFVPEPLALPTHGLVPVLFEETVRSDGLLDGVAMGITEAHMMVREVFLTIRRMVSGEVSAQNLGGIITIGRLTHRFAGAGLGPLLFFLAIISIHLGVINLLPIPALDGGHLLFLLVERVRGRPLGERAQTWVNLAGFAFVLTLVVFVTWLDIRRLF